MIRYLTVVALLLAGVAHAGEARHLYTEVSQPGETMDEFVLRIAPKAANYTRRMDVEVCGTIMPQGDGWKLDIATSGERTWCASPDVNGALNFHTHPKGTKAHFSDADYAWPGYLASAGRVYFQNGKGTVRAVDASVMVAVQ